MCSMKARLGAGFAAWTSEAISLAVSAGRAPASRILHVMMINCDCAGKKEEERGGGDYQGKAERW